MSKMPSKKEALNASIDQLLSEREAEGAFDAEWVTDQLLIRGVRASLKSQRDALRKEVVEAMRSQNFTYKGVYSVRKKINVRRKLEDGTWQSLWSFSETANPQFWEESLTQSWNGLANHAFRVYSNLTYYNNEKNPGEKFQLEFNLNDENADREQGRSQDRDENDLDVDGD